MGYRKPSAKAPVIHPGDEAPFLVWGGEGSTLSSLTEVVQPAMLGRDVLAQEKGRAHGHKANEREQASHTENANVSARTAPPG